MAGQGPEKVSPLTIIALFAGVIEASALAALPFLAEESKTIYTWFLVGFPPYLTLLFFLTLNFNNRALYSPEELEERTRSTQGSAPQRSDAVLSGQMRGIRVLDVRGCIGVQQVRAWVRRKRGDEDTLHLILLDTHCGLTAQQLLRLIPGGHALCYDCDRSALVANRQT